MHSLLFTGSLLLFLAVNTALAEAAPVLRLNAPPKRARVGEPFPYTIRMEWTAGEENYEVTPAMPAFQNLAVTDQSQSQETEGGISRLTLSFTLAGIQKGPAKISAFEVPYRRPGDSPPWERLPVPDQFITILSPFPWPAVAGGLAFLVALPLGIFFIRKAMRACRDPLHKKDLPPPDPKQRVYAKAEECIAAYKGETQQDTVTHWMAGVKETVLAYYDLPLRSVTEGEILIALKSRSLLTEEINKIDQIFRKAESLKFMGQMLPVREMEALQKTLLQYVRGKIIIKNSNS